ncbi:type II secretion system protein [Cerasicoccus maritimus]|uniref:type II secretion system protein n=1 Tax=Cerasicoccus maritimus TaxID=490089 RepID=UPI0028529509|nr:type II secretion system protein [Cerasicoccus maritimus]
MAPLSHHTSRAVSDAREAFTLVELLAVLGIIAVLAGILFSVLGNSRASADQTKCASNLRQMQLASISYAAEKGYFAPVQILEISDSGKETRGYWNENELFLDYLGHDAIPECPVYQATKEADPSGAGNHSYGMNFTNLKKGWGDEGPRTALVVQVINPTEIIAFADALDLQIASWGAQKYEEGSEKYAQHAIAYRHNGQANVVHFDGSVALLTREEVVGNNDIWKIEQ